MTQSATIAPPDRRVARRDAAVLGGLALALRIPALVAHRHHHPDDGIYGMSAVAMRHGAAPFRDLFSSQGPLHLPLIWIGDLPRAYWSPRVAATTAGVAVTVLVYFIGRRLWDRPAALLAAVLVTTSGSMLWTTGPITSDGPTVAFVCAAFLLALRYEDSASNGAAAAIGLAAAAAVLVKPAVGVLGALPAAWMLVRGRKRGHLAIATASALALGVAVSVPFGASRVWDQVVIYQLHSDREQSIAANLHKVVRTLLDRDLVLVVVLVVALVASAVARGRDEARSHPRAGINAPLLVWAVPTFVFLTMEPALWRNHLAALVVPFALIATTRRVPCAWLVVAALLAAPLQVAHLDDILQPPAYAPSEQAAVDALRELPPSARVITDEVGLVWQAGRRTPNDFVDTSIKQIQQGRITTARLVQTASKPGVCAVLVWRSTHFGSLPGLARALVDAGYRPTDRFAPQGSRRVLYERPECGVDG